MFLTIKLCTHSKHNCLKWNLHKNGFGVNLSLKWNLHKNGFGVKQPTKVDMI